MIRFGLLAFAMGVSVSCSSLPVPGAGGAPGGEEAAARRVIEASAAKTGNAWERYREVKVGYDGEWAPLAVRLQPVLTDPGFRKSSIETYSPRTMQVRQVHTGPLAKKLVERRRPETRVALNGTPATDAEVRDSAALVADAYTAFLFGSSWLAETGRGFRLLEPRVLDGELCDLISAKISPGFGPAQTDEVIAWIGRESRLMRRFQFTLTGLDATRGADVDVTFSNHFTAPDGSIWPRNFVEYIHRPLLAKAHEWRMTSLVLDGKTAIR